MEAATDYPFSADPQNTSEHFGDLRALATTMSMPFEFQRDSTARPAAIRWTVRHLGSSSRGVNADDRTEDPVDRRRGLNAETPMQG